MRDILLFPKFENENVIEDIRRECDRLYGIIKPHITLVFPFEDDISDEELISKVRNILREEKKFFVKFEGISYSDDGYIFLKCIDGEKQIVRLHDLLYHDLLRKHLSNRTYIPHITLGQTENCKDDTKIHNLSDCFECRIEEIHIEKIGEHQESIILDSIPLK